MEGWDEQYPAFSILCFLDCQNYPYISYGDLERTEKDIFDFQEEEEDGDAPRNGKYTLKSVKKIDHYSRLVIFGENV